MNWLQIVKYSVKQYDGINTNDAIIDVDSVKWVKLYNNWIKRDEKSNFESSFIVKDQNGIVFEALHWYTMVLSILKASFDLYILNT